jgi:hypothetical protein
MQNEEVIEYLLKFPMNREVRVGIDNTQWTVLADVEKVETHQPDDWCGIEYPPVILLRGTGGESTPENRSLFDSLAHQMFIEDAEAEAAKRTFRPLVDMPFTYTAPFPGYDASHQIDDEDGDMRAEIGMGISQTDDGGNVVAFEVWHFDRPAVRTMTWVFTPAASYPVYEEHLKSRGTVVVVEKDMVIRFATPNFFVVLKVTNCIVNSGAFQHLVVQYNVSEAHR